MKFNSKYFLPLVFILAYLALRLASILTIPFFQDEADYIFFSKIALSSPNLSLYSLHEGVKPFFIWLVMPFLLIGGEHVVISARMVSLITGLISMLTLYFLSLELFKKRSIGILSMAIFILFPYAQIYNSLALLESTVAMFILLSLLFSIKLVRNPSLGLAYAFGVFTGLGILTKRHAFFSLYLLPLSFLFFEAKRKFVKRKLLFIAALFAFSIVIIFSMQLILRLSPYFERIAWFEGGNIFTKRAWIVLPFNQKLFIFMTNFKGSIVFLIQYLTIPYVILLGYSLTLAKKYKREILILAAFLAVPFLILNTFGRWTSERYVYPMSLPLIPIIALSLYSISKKIKIYFIFFIFPFIYILLIILSPLNSPLPTKEKHQYFTCDMNVFSRDIVYLKGVSRNRKILIGTTNTLGFKNAMILLLNDNKNITVKGYFPQDYKLPDQIIESSRKIPTFYAIVSAGYRKIQTNQSIKIISEKKGLADACTYRLYKVGDK